MSADQPIDDLADSVAVIERLVLGKSESSDIERTSWTELLEYEPLKSAYAWLLARAEEVGVKVGEENWAMTVMLRVHDLEQILRYPEEPLEHLIHEGDDEEFAYWPVLRLCEARIARGEGGTELIHVAQRLRSAWRQSLERRLADEAVRSVKGPLELLRRYDREQSPELWQLWLNEVENLMAEVLPSGRRPLVSVG